MIYVIDISNCLLFRPKSWHYDMLSLSQEVNIHLLLRVSNNLSFHICWIILAALIYESWSEFKFKTGTVCNACSWHKNRFTCFRHVTEFFSKIKIKTYATIMNDIQLLFWFHFRCVDFNLYLIHNSLVR